MMSLHTAVLCLTVGLLVLSGCEKGKLKADAVPGERQIAVLLASQTNSTDTVRAIRRCLSEMPGALTCLPTEEARERWIDRWEASLWRLPDGANSYREKMSIVCAIEEAVFAVKAARERDAPNSGCGWEVIVRWLDWYAHQVKAAESAKEEGGLAERENGGNRQSGIVYARRHFQRGLLSMFKKKYLYALRNRWLPELEKALPPGQATQIREKLTDAAERIAAECSPTSPTSATVPCDHSQDPF